MLGNARARALRVVVADDEAMARKRARRLVESLGHSVVCECTSGAEVIEAARTHTPDVALLDIDMPELDGMEAAEALDVPFIFVSAHDRALEAFERGALHYLQKPLGVRPLREALERVPAPSASLGRLAINTASGVVLVPRGDITHVSFDGHLCTVFSAKGEWTTDTSLGELESALGEGFARVHRRVLIQLHKLVRLENRSNGSAIAHLDGGASAIVSRQAARDLRRVLLQGSIWQPPR